MKTRSYVSLRVRALRSAASASARRTSASIGSIPSARRLSRSARSARRVALDEHRACRAARERLDPQRAGAGEQVEHARSGDVREHREQRLPDAVGGGPRGRRAPRRLQAPAAELSRDHPHASNRRGCASGPGSRSRGDRRNVPRRRTCARGPRRAARARASSARDRRRRSPRRGRALARAAGRPPAGSPPRTGGSRTAACPRARPPCAAPGRSRPGGSRRRDPRARAASASGGPTSKQLAGMLAPARPARAADAAGRCRSSSAFSTIITVAFGTSMPTSITVVATSTSALPEANADIACCFSRGRMRAVQQRQLIAPQLALAQALELGGGARGPLRAGRPGSARRRPPPAPTAHPATPRPAGRRRRPAGRRSAARAAPR